MDKSPFNKLAAEIRNYIYYLALVEDSGIALVADPKEQDYRARKYREYPPNVKHMLALTSTCRQIRNESFSVFLGQNQFFVLPDIQYKSTENRFMVKPCACLVLCWMASLGPWATCLRSLELGLDLSTGAWNQKAAFAVQELRNTFKHRKLRLAITASDFICGSDFLDVDLNGGDSDVIRQKLDKDCERMKAKVDSLGDRQSGEVKESMHFSIEMMQEGSSIVLGYLDKWEKEGVSQKLWLCK